MIIIIIQILIISAGTPLASNSFHFSWNLKYIEFWDQYICFPVKVEGMTDERVTSADYY